jgi:proteic killer suppression protein
MIASFRSKALRQFWEEGDRRGLRPDFVERVAVLLDALDIAEAPEDMVAHDQRFHSLQGKPRRYALRVNKNWRITFSWEGKNAVEVDLVDYH